jgi:hypothetical protein
VLLELDSLLGPAVPEMVSYPDRQRHSSTQPRPADYRADERRWVNVSWCRISARYVFDAVVLHRMEIPNNSSTCVSAGSLGSTSIALRSSTGVPSKMAQHSKSPRRETYRIPA